MRDNIKKEAALSCWLKDELEYLFFPFLFLAFMSVYTFETMYYHHKITTTTQKA